MRCNIQYYQTVSDKRFTGCDIFSSFPKVQYTRTVFIHVANKECNSTMQRTTRHNTTLNVWCGGYFTVSHSYKRYTWNGWLEDKVVSFIYVTFYSWYPFFFCYLCLHFTSSSVLIQFTVKDTEYVHADLTSKHSARIL